MPNTNPKFNPSYSTVKSIFLLNSDGKTVGQNGKANNDERYILDITKTNIQCQFERVEFVENITDVFPSGALIVRDLIDIASFLEVHKISQIQFNYASGAKTVFDITSNAYITNAASATEQNYVSIYFSNVFYKYSQSHSLNSDLLALDKNWAIPQVYKISEFIEYVYLNIIKPIPKLDLLASAPIIDKTNNYLLYKTLNPKEYRIESPTDNIIQYLNYLASAAAPSAEDTPPSESGPRFMFWTDFNNNINFKYFPIDIKIDKSFSKIDQNYLRFSVYNNEDPVQKLADGKQYRKLNHFRTDPNNQYVSKNYHYVRKVPKVYDICTLSNPGNSYYADVLSYQFQDEGQKYNIEVINSKGLTGATAGSDEIICEDHWGYYNELEPVSDGQVLTLLGQDFGNQKKFANLDFMGNTGYFQYVDNPDMWKNMFDMTEVHPHYPDDINLPPEGIAGNETHLQDILFIRYKNFLATIGNSADSDRLELSRKIEKQNFIMYVLCCMGKETEPFFALLTQYELDNTVGNTGSGDPTVTSTYKPYRYNWVKLNFNSTYGNSGPAAKGNTANGNCGATYYMHQIEKWDLDNVWKGNTSQDETWAINVNERPLGLTINQQTYLPPGWVSPIASSGFKWRPVGAKQATFDATKGDISHIVKMDMIPYADLLMDSKNLVGNSYIGKYLYYFSVENVVDGLC